MTKIALPVGFSYSMSYQGNQKRASQRVSREEFREFMQAGMTYKDVNEKIPMARSTYDKMLDKYGYPKDHIRMKTMRQDSIENMLNAGKSLEEIAEAHNVTVTNCRQILNNMGISYSKFIGEAKKTQMAALANTPNYKKEFTQSLNKSTVQGWLDTYKTVKNIAANVHLSQTTVYKYIKFFGLHI